MDVSKVRVVVESMRKQVAATQAEVSAVTTATIKAGEKDPTQFSGLRDLGRANLMIGKIPDRLDQVLDALDKAIEHTAPRVKKAKEDKPVVKK